MKSNRRLYIILALVLAIGISVCSILLYAASQRPQVFDKYEVANAKFRMRVTAYHEHIPIALPSARYVFQSAAVGSEDWHEILTVKTDQPISIPHDQNNFVLDHVAYMFFDNYYMVTTDSGRTWFVWDANKELPADHKQYNLWPAVKAIEMRPDGTGRMTLYPWISKDEKGPDLHTSDYGHHWAIDNAVSFPAHPTQLPY